MRIVILVFGTRGELQPLTALALGLQAAGHHVRVVTQSDFYDFVTSRGVDCAPIHVDIRSADKTRDREGNYPLFTVYKIAREFMDRALADVWEGCKDADAIILCDMGVVPGVHVVDKLQVPTFIARFYPDLEVEKFWRHGLAGRLAKLKEVLVFKLSSHLVIHPLLRRWRKHQLKLPPRPRKADQGELMDKGIPMFDAYSPTVFPKPSYWPDWAHVTGYWFLDHPADWQPSDELRDFLAAGPPPVYIGFSSVVNYDMEKMTNLSLKALALTGQRGILAAGWSNLGQKPSLPESVLAIEGAPHDWLFPRVAAAVHHGGAGTTGVALRTATPNIIVPFTYDNPFWAWRVAELGAGPPGIPHKELTAERLADAIHTVLHDEAMRRRQREVSQAIQAEDGIARAVELFHQYTNRKAA